MMCPRLLCSSLRSSLAGERDYTRSSADDGDEEANVKAFESVFSSSRLFCLHLSFHPRRPRRQQMRPPEASQAMSRQARFPTNSLDPMLDLLDSSSISVEADIGTTIDPCARRFDTASITLQAIRTPKPSALPLADDDDENSSDFLWSATVPMSLKPLDRDPEDRRRVLLHNSSLLDDSDGFSDFQASPATGQPLSSKPYSDDPSSDFRLFASSQPSSRSTRIYNTAAKFSAASDRTFLTSKKDPGFDFLGLYSQSLRAPSPSRPISKPPHISTTSPSSSKPSASTRAA
ncbi:uncharacterized protein B0H18DRAFT_1214743 [Fomitopsis serialis]|uniref:uncharacterized protein n=1 Tax=Fomitopsis serialis TaxID=139415 RepID=UPI0020088A2D|nr:uncharacterized protein B0H18DRAFT_1214743 [Neoantrodia serialis]KAH9917169.1 hypothetical protein B0H18DRAFT_1214743 [Neoantrodia serialis]